MQDQQTSDVPEGVMKPTAFITSLFDQLAAISSATVKSRPRPAQLPSEARTILLTLHVLFPHSLLDALDLLDRGLVIKLLYKPPSALSSTTSAVASPHEHTARDDNERGPQSVHNPDSAGQVQEHVRWHVLSSQSLPSDDRSRWQSRNQQYQSRSYGSDRRGSGYYNSRDDRDEHAGGIGGGTSYAVHPKAWNCSCPAFAFAAVAAAKSVMPSTSNRGGERGEEARNTGDNVQDLLGDAVDLRSGAHGGGMESLWRAQLLQGAAQSQSVARTTAALPFGGLTGNTHPRGRETVPPICKHLLACLLADKCPAFFMPEATGDGDHVRSEDQHYTQTGPGPIGQEGRKGVVVRRTDDIHEVAAWAAGIVGA